MIDCKFKKILEGFILEIKRCSNCDDAKDIRKRIHDFYQSHDIPEDEDVLAQSGMCECLAMLTGECFF